MPVTKKKKRTLIVDVRKDHYDVYVGRRDSGMHYGNPFTHYPIAGTCAAIHVRTREEAVARFETWVRGESDRDVEPRRREWILGNLEALRGRVLGCYCAPELCHANVLIRLAEERR